VFPWHANRLPGKEIAVYEGHELGMLLRKAYLSFHRRANSWWLEHGVTADQFVLLTIVAREPGITQISIVERTSLDPNTVAAVPRRLEQRRLVRREAHGRDRRLRCVYLTAEGRRVQERTPEDAEPILTALSDCTADCDRTQSERFLKSFHRVFSLPPTEANGRPTRRPPQRRGTM
jgi:MarR family transcriptional regulator for hemolysin